MQWKRRKRDRNRRDRGTTLRLRGSSAPARMFDCAEGSRIHVEVLPLQTSTTYKLAPSTADIANYR